MRRHLILALLISLLMVSCGYRVYIIRDNHTVNITLEQFSVEKKGGQYEFSPTVDVGP